MNSLIRVFLNPLDSGSCVEYPVEAGTRIIDFLQREYPDGFGSMIRVIVGNQEIPIDDIDYVIQPEERITILVMPGVTGAEVGVFLIKALVFTAIGYVINYIFAPKAPSLDLKGEESVVYSLNPTRNAVRLGEPIEVGYGQCSYPPSFASAPYSFFYQPTNDQYVDELLCLGAGQYTVEGVYIGDTPVSAFEPGTVKYWVFLPGEHNQRLGTIEQAVNAETAGTECDWLFSENVFTSPEIDGIVFNQDTNEQIVSSGFSGTVYAGFQDQETGEQTLDRIEGVDSSIRLSEGDTLTIAGSTLNDGSFVIGSKVVNPDNPLLMTIWPTWKYFKTFSDEVLTDPPVTYELNITNKNISAGPFRCQKLGREVYRIDCDFVFPRGLHRVDGSTGKTKYHAISFRFTYQRIDEETGFAIGDPITKDVLFHEKRRDVIRATITSGVIPTGAYEVTVERTAGYPVEDNDDQTQTSLPDDDTRKVEETNWTGLKGYVQHDRTKPAYGRCTLMAVRLKATNGVAQAAQARIRVIATRRGFNADTSNAALVLEDIWTDTDYGLGRPIEDLDTAKIAELEGLWRMAGAKFHGIFDKRSTGFDAMDSVASLMGAKVFQDGGLTTIAQDGLQPVRTAMFSSANMANLKLDYTFDSDDDFDGVQTSWRDPLTFDEKFSIAPADSINPDKFDLFGCTDGDYAQKMAQYLWNVRLKRRKRATFDVEMDGLIPKFMDRIGLSSPLPDYGQSGVFINYISGNTWKVDQPLDWSINKQNYMIVRDNTGMPSNQLRVEQGGSQDEVTFIDNPPAIYTPDDGQEPSSYAFGLTYNLIKDFVVTKVSPRSDTSVQIEAQVYDEAVYAGAPEQMVGDTVLYCDRFGLVPGGEIKTQEVLYSVDSQRGYIDGVVGQLKNDSLLAVRSNNIYWLKQVAGTLAPVEQMKNEMRYSSDFGDTWTIAARGYDDWTASVWANYDGNNYPANTTIRNMTTTDTGIIYAAQHSDTYNHIIYEVPYGAGSVTEDHRPLHSCFTYTGQGQNWTGQSWKTGGATYISLSSSREFLTCGTLNDKLDGIVNINLGSTFYDSRETGAGDWAPPGDSETGELEDGARLYGSGLPRPSLIQDTLSSSGGQERIDCQQIATVGYRTYISAGTSDVWRYDRESVEIASKGNFREMWYSEWSDNSNQYIPVETTYEWKYPENSEPGIITDRNAEQLSESATTWGWFTLNRGGYSSSLVWPKSGVAGETANKGKFHIVNADIDESGFDYSDWFLGNQGLNEEDRVPLPEQLWRSYLYSEQDIDLSSLLVPLDANETTLDVCRVYTDTNYPGERFILVYAFNHTNTSDGWPLRFYMRAAGTFALESFSDPVTIENPVIAGSNPAGVQLAAREAGGWRLQYSSTQKKFVTATIYLTNPGTYKEVVCAFDDPFICELTNSSPVY